MSHRSETVGGAFVGGLPVVDPVTAWLQSGALLGLDDLIVMGDALAGRWSPHGQAREVPVAHLVAAVGRWGRRRGARRLQQALPWLRDGVWSPRETALRLVIVRAGLPEPGERNAEIRDAAGRLLGHGDLVYRRLRLVIEYEGDHHRTDRQQWRRDLAKYEAYADAGWRVVRVTDDDLERPRILIGRLSRLLTEEAVA
jgi:hypothetical protein